LRGWRAGLLQPRKLLFKLLVAILKLLVRSGELAHLVFEPV